MNEPTPGLPLTDRAKRVFKKAREEQQQLRHPVVCAEHVLLGLLSDKRALACFVLRELKVDLDKLELEARDYLKRSAPDIVVGEVAILQASEPWVVELQQQSIGTEHLLLALRGSRSAVGKWLAAAGVTQPAMVETTKRLFNVVQRGSGPTTAPEE
jgi:ATP-dependent Clp protease ATP-binding subunit ClpA